MNKTFNNNDKSFIKILTLNNFGIGKKRSLKFFKALGLNNRVNPTSFKRKQVNEIAKKSQTIYCGKRLKDGNRNVINFLLKNKSYRGMRHKLKYPARGQRTHTNAKTKKKFKY